jgi:GDP-L-fucose synthase
VNKSARIFVAGHRGLVGSGIVRKLEAAGYENLLLRTRAELDLTDSAAVAAFFEHEKPELVFLAAAHVGGILANDTYPVEFLLENLKIQNNVIENAYCHGVAKLLFLGSSCIYPRLAEQPIREDSLLTGPLEKTNQWYAIAKIAGLKLCEAYNTQYGANFISAMPTNLYGPQDNFDLQTSHVLPALLRKFHEAKLAGRGEVEIWGSGKPLREFLHVDDLADACLFLMENYDDPALINVGSGTEVTIAELARLVAETVGFEGDLRFDPDKPDGTPRKLMDSSRLFALGWQPRITLTEGLAGTYAWACEQEFGHEIPPAWR